MTDTLPAPLVLDLGPTATYARRLATWRQTAPGEWVLVIELRRTDGGAPESDTYAVQEEPSAGDRRIREFLLLNTTDPEQPDVYGVVYGYGVTTCSCTAGRVKRYECKHMAAVVGLITKGSGS